jgi:hypothetical protein
MSVARKTRGRRASIFDSVEGTGTSCGTLPTVVVANSHRGGCICRLVALEFYRELLVVTHESGNMLDSWIRVVCQIALYILAQLEHVKVAGRVQSDSRSWASLGPCWAPCRDGIRLRSRY